MIRINLLPVRAARKKETLKQQLTIAAFALVTVAAMLFYIDHTQVSKIKRVEDEIKKNEAEIARLKTIIGEVGKLKARKKDLEDKTKVIEKLKSSRTGPVRMMDELSSVIPQKAWILSMSENGASITLAAEAVNEEVISDFMLNMEKSPFFADIRLTQITNVGTGNTSKKSFGLSARRLTPSEESLKARSAPTSEPAATVPEEKSKEDE